MARNRSAFFHASPPFPSSIRPIGPPFSMAIAHIESSLIVRANLRHIGPHQASRNDSRDGIARGANGERLKNPTASIIVGFSPGRQTKKKSMFSTSEYTLSPPTPIPSRYVVSSGTASDIELEGVAWSSVTRWPDSGLISTAFRLARPRLPSTHLQANSRQWASNLCGGLPQPLDIGRDFGHPLGKRDYFHGCAT